VASTWALMMKLIQRQRLFLLHDLLDGRHGAGDGGLVVPR